MIAFRDDGDVIGRHVQTAVNDAASSVKDDRFFRIRTSAAKIEAGHRHDRVAFIYKLDDTAQKRIAVAFPEQAGERVGIAIGAPVDRYGVALQRFDSPFLKQQPMQQRHRFAAGQ